MNEDSNSTIKSPLNQPRTLLPPEHLSPMVGPMSEDDFTSIVHESLSMLQSSHQQIYQFCEYIYFAGQYELAIPESLLAQLSPNNTIDAALNNPVNRNLVFRDINFPTLIRTISPLVARTAIRFYHSDLYQLIRTYIDATSIDRREQRTFLQRLLEYVARETSLPFIHQMLFEHEQKLQALITTCGNAELMNWAQLYTMVGDINKAEQIMQQGLYRFPETELDWVAAIKQTEQKGSAEQKSALPGKVTAWLAANPQDTNVRHAYIGFIERQGTLTDISHLIQETAQWLNANPQNVNVRQIYLKFIEHWGTAEQLADLLQATGQWLLDNPDDTQVRQTYLGLVERAGTAADIAHLIEQTFDWLSSHPEDVHVRQAYLSLVERCGTAEQISRLIEATADWLLEHPLNPNIRQAYFKFVEHCGTHEQTTALLTDTAHWLTLNPRIAMCARYI
ncbi:hypothetical protein [Dictyobacter kobayashii]|uniref:Uncharacterized protein n=1 Tax=Dictyobacter kobayashii TaxID=2014872 RepID=A0A402AWA6_9CHLR|nr:hypothetical protein [Dictyobacter kobayashii]GCE23355.1 hypothetical protein KDK_71550 [Dictyobacter kobayashii]